MLMNDTPSSGESSSPLFTTAHGQGGEIPTTQGIRSWLLDAIMEDATHVVVVCDQFDYEDYPVQVMPGEDVHEVEERFREASMQKVMEVYWLGGDIEEQLSQRRSFTYGPEESDE